MPKRKIIDHDHDNRITMARYEYTHVNELNIDDPFEERETADEREARIAFEELMAFCLNDLYKNAAA